MKPITLGLEMPIVVRDRPKAATPTSGLIIGGVDPYAAGWGEFRQTSAIREGYGRNATVHACVNVIARAAAGVNWLLYRRPAGMSATAGTRPAVMKAMSSYRPASHRNRGVLETRRRGGIIELDYRHPLLKLLSRPNPSQGRAAFVEEAVSRLLLTGNGFVVGVAPTNKPSAELWGLRPDRVEVVPDPTERIRAYKYRVGGREQEFPAANVLHLTLFNPLDDYYGLSPLQAAARAIVSDNEAARWNYSLLRNDARPSGAVVTPETLTENQHNRLREQLEDTYSGSGNAGRPILLEGGLDWKPFGLSPQDMDWLNTRKLSKREIAHVFGVPPELVGDTDSKTYSNYKEARKALYHEVVIPRLDHLRDELNNWLTPQFGDDLYLEYDRDGIEALQGDRAELWNRIETSTCLTVNEKRAALGYDDVPDGDEILISASMTPLRAIDGGL
jgi:HK97 family phage portal protein